MSFKLASKTRESPVMGAIVNRFTGPTTIHLVAANGTVVCRCSLHPEMTVLIEEAEISPKAAALLCAESKKKYEEMTDAI